MDFQEIFLESLNTLTINKMRTGLAVLGIVIGIASVIALISLGQATQKAIQEQIQSLGSNLLTIRPGAISQGGVMGAAGSRASLTLEDAKALTTSPEITLIEKVSPEVERRMQVSTGQNNANLQVIGVTPAYAEVHKINLSLGVFISQKDVDSITKVAVLGPQAVIDLFGENNNPLGQIIRINKQAFTVIGITTSKGGTGFFNQDEIVYVPLTTAQKQLFGINYLNSIGLQVKSQELMVEAQDQVGYFLLKRHQISDPTKADFSIMSQQDLLNTASSTTQTFTALLSGIAAISLLVGGIGIMNIMLVTVSERIREIGLRKALGAKRKDLILQFLTEAVILTFSGGLLGIIVGILVSYLLSQLTQSAFLISLPAILLAFIVSTIIGIVFGWYPAQKAAKLQPIEALRYE